jgi:hypothetical protein
MRQDIESLITKISSKFCARGVVDNPIEKDAAIKLFKYYSKLQLNTRAAIFPAIQSIAGTFVC